MRTSKITLAGTTYTVSELPRRRNAEWRQQLRDTLGSLVDFLDVAPALAEKPGREVLPQVGDLARQLLGSVDQVSDLLFAYSPELEADRERIEDEAYDSEIMEALITILQLAFPFGALAGRLISLGSPGQATRET